MIVLRSPKGWTGPKVVDGKKTEGTVRSHQVPMGDMSQPGHVKILEKWLKSYRPQELFDQTGKLRSELAFAVFWTSQKFPTLEHNHHPPESA